VCSSDLTNYILQLRTEIMAKSIRSKIKRQHRSEFRRTVGEAAAQKSMQVVQSKLKEAQDKGSMDSFARLSSLLDTQKDDEREEMVDDSISQLPLADALWNKGENKVLPKKTGMRYGSKRKLKSKPKKEGATPVKKERRTPKFYCEFK